MSLSVVVLDLGMGNLASVRQALVRAAAEAGLSCDVAIASDPDALRDADRLVAPGQGAFRDCARALEGGLGQALTERIEAGIPYFGICLGLQMLFEGSDEAPAARGLGWLGGRVLRLDPGEADARGQRAKIPHMGWNELELHPAGQARGAGPLAAIADRSHVYFVHSYHAVPTDRSIVVATCTHGPNTVTAAVRRDNVFATQFHPEKSQAAGIAILAAFLRGEASP